jgi:hypothetical protein
LQKWIEPPIQEKKMNRIDRVQDGVPMVVQDDFNSVAWQMLGVFEKLLLTATGRHKGPRVGIKEHARGDGFMHSFRDRHNRALVRLGKHATRPIDVGFNFFGFGGPVLDF